MRLPAEETASSETVQIGHVLVVDIEITQTDKKQAGQLECQQRLPQTSKHFRTVAVCVDCIQALGFWSLALACARQLQWSQTSSDMIDVQSIFIIYFAVWETMMSWCVSGDDVSYTCRCFSNWSCLRAEIRGRMASMFQPLFALRSPASEPLQVHG